MELRFDYQNLLYSDHIRCGITKDTVKDLQPKCIEAHQDILQDRKANILGFYELPEQDVSQILDYLKTIESQFDTMVVLGIGGSALGNRAVYSALKTELELKKKLLVCDNVDPTMLYDILEQINWDKTIFNLISKSGTTSETMAAYMIIADILRKKFPADYRQRMIITTDAKKGFLRDIINKEGYPSFVVPDNVGGRFSVLTDVGLVSSAFVGLNIKALLSGVEAMKLRCEGDDTWHNPAYLNGLLHYQYMRQGKNISVMMPYANPLYDCADWYRQLWAESLGKRYNRQGKEVFVGQTPVKALGTTDQHSQVQLYTEGPNDKVFTFLTVEKFKHDYIIPDIYPDRDEVNFLANKPISRLLNTERLATEIALTRAGRPNANITFPELNEYTLGQFIMMYQIQTVFTGKLLNIDPLDQPGVEAGKISTYAMMGKAGYDKELQSIDKYLAERNQLTKKPLTD
jgi:glucose-6-phosphate isomerase